jgi:phosphonate transport system permease protein
VSIEEKDPTEAVDIRKSVQKSDFLRELADRPEAVLLRPFGKPNWPIFGLVVALSAVAIIFFADIINLGKLDLNWTIQFDVNILTTLVIIIAGIVSVAPRAVKNPQILREQSTFWSLVVLVVVALFILFKVVDLGTFTYTITKLDSSTLVAVVPTGGLLFLAWRGSKVATTALSLFFLWWGFNIINFGFITVTDLFTSENGGRLLRSMTPPNWKYFTKVIDPMLLTIQTAVASTVLGIIIALPLSILAARNTSPHPIIYNVVRLIINFIRAVPSLIWALLFIPFVGLGPGAGILGLALHSVSVLTKLYSEAFESVKPQPLEALSAAGANGLKRFRWGVFPQAFPLVASYSIFNWESNGRDSTVVAFVGGGGIGFLLQANLSLLDYANVTVMLIVLILTVSLLDRFSDFVRSRII